MTCAATRTAPPLSTAALLVALVASLAAIGVAEAQPRLSSDTKSALAELDRAFTFEGRPVNPKAVNDLLGWLSDSLPGPSSIDVEGAQNANRYYGQVTQDAQGRVRLTTEATRDMPAEWVEYERVGRLASGEHVLWVSSNSGGSGIFMTLLVVRFSIGRDYDDDHWRTTLMMSRVGAIPLGDRFSGDVKVSGTSIHIGADKRLGRPARIVTLK